jgi:hypothetical protein
MRIAILKLLSSNIPQVLAIGSSVAEVSELVFDSGIVAESDCGRILPAVQEAMQSVVFSHGGSAELNLRTPSHTLFLQKLWSA